MKLKIKKPVVSEKAYALVNSHKYTFNVEKGTSKDQIRAEAEKLFGVNVLSVNSMNIRGKVKSVKRVPGKRQDYKKVILTLDKKQNIALFDIEKEGSKNKKEPKAEKTAEKSANKDVEVKIKAKS